MLKCLQCRRTRFNHWVGKILWRRKWQPTPVPLPGKSHGWRSVVGFSPWGHKESGTTEQPNNDNLCKSPNVMFDEDDPVEIST